MSEPEYEYESFIEPPNPQAECSCGLDASTTGYRVDLICRKHDGRFGRRRKRKPASAPGAPNEQEEVKGAIRLDGNDRCVTCGHEFYRHEWTLATEEYPEPCDWNNKDGECGCKGFVPNPEDLQDAQLVKIYH